MTGNSIGLGSHTLWGQCQLAWTQTLMIPDHNSRSIKLPCDVTSSWVPKCQVWEAHGRSIHNLSKEHPLPFDVFWDVRLFSTQVFIVVLLFGQWCLQDSEIAFFFFLIKTPSRCVSPAAYPVFDKFTHQSWRISTNCAVCFHQQPKNVPVKKCQFSGATDRRTSSFLVMAHEHEGIRGSVSLGTDGRRFLSLSLIDYHKTRTYQLVGQVASDMCHSGHRPHLLASWCQSMLAAQIVFFGRWQQPMKCQMLL